MRLFVGIDMPATVKDEVAALIERLRPGAPEAKWVPRDNLHVTLSFLGEVGEERVNEIGSAVHGAATWLRGPIPTAVYGFLGTFPSARRARVLWVGLEDGEGLLGALADAVAGALAPLGFPREKRSWAAHLTVARFRAPRDATAMLGIQVKGLPFDVSEVTLFRSRLARPAPTYEAIRRLPLGG